MSRFVHKDLLMRCEWAGITNEATERLLHEYGEEHLDEIIDCVWLIGLYRHSNKWRAPKGKNLKEKALVAFESLPMPVDKLGESTRRFLGLPVEREEEE